MQFPAYRPRRPTETVLYGVVRAHLATLPRGPDQRGPKVPGPLVDYLDEMISATPVEVIADYAPALLSFDQTAALPALAGIPTVIVAGDKDRMTPLARSQAIADALPDAEFVVASGSGHMAMMEDAELVNDALRRMLERAAVDGELSEGPRKARR